MTENLQSLMIDLRRNLSDLGKDEQILSVILSRQAISSENADSILRQKDVNAACEKLIPKYEKISNSISYLQKSYSAAIAKFTTVDKVLTEMQHVTEELALYLNECGMRQNMLENAPLNAMALLRWQERTQLKGSWKDLGKGPPGVTKFF